MSKQVRRRLSEREAKLLESGRKLEGALRAALDAIEEMRRLDLAGPIDSGLWAESIGLRKQLEWIERLPDLLYSGRVAVFREE